MSWLVSAHLAPNAYIYVVSHQLVVFHSWVFWPKPARLHKGAQGEVAMRKPMVNCLEIPNLVAASGAACDMFFENARGSAEVSWCGVSLAYYGKILAAIRAVDREFAYIALGPQGPHGGPMGPHGTPWGHHGTSIWLPWDLQGSLWAPEANNIDFPWFFNGFLRFY